MKDEYKDTQTGSEVDGESGEKLTLSQIEKRARSLLVFANAKAGTKEEERARINKILYESSKNSAYFQNEERKAEVVEAKLRRIKEKILHLRKRKSAGNHLTELQQASTRRLIHGLQKQVSFCHTWMHIDMDMFYAAVEIRDNPSLKGKPVAIGGMGMISTANYEARKFGVRSAMPGFMGKKLCPSLIFVRPNFKKYTHVASQVREILRDYDPDFEAVSLDEASVDLTQYIIDNYEDLKQRSGEVKDGDTTACDSGNTELKCIQGSTKGGVYEIVDAHEGNENVNDKNQRPPINCRYIEFSKDRCVEAGRLGAIIATEIRERIFQVTRLTASAGIASSRTLAKICSDLNKPNGQYHLESSRESVSTFMANLNVRKLPGVGKVMERVLNELGITKCQQVIGEGAPLILEYYSKKTSTWLLRAAVGVNKCRCLRQGTSVRKGIGNERTFRATSDRRFLRKKCVELCQLVASRMEKSKTMGKCLTIKLKDSKFVVHTRAVTLDRYVNSADDMINAALQLLEAEIAKASLQKRSLTLRLMGVRMNVLLDTNRNKSSSTVGSQKYTPSFFSFNDDDEGSRRGNDKNATDTSGNSSSSAGNISKLAPPTKGIERFLHRNKMQTNLKISESEPKKEDCRPQQAGYSHKRSPGRTDTKLAIPRKTCFSSWSSASQSSSSSSSSSSSGINSKSKENQPRENLPFRKMTNEVIVSSSAIDSVDSLATSRMNKRIDKMFDLHSSPVCSTSSTSKLKPDPFRRNLEVARGQTNCRRNKFISTKRRRTQYDYSKLDPLVLAELPLHIQKEIEADAARARHQTRKKNASRLEAFFPRKGKEI